MGEPIANPKAMKASQVLGRFAECQRRLEEAGLPFGAFQWPIDDADFRARLVEFWMSRGGKQEIVDVNQSVFKVIVDYTKSLAEMIAAGKYDYVNSDITEKHFPLPKPPAGLPAKAELNLELVHFNKYITSEEAIAELKKRGLRPATLPELLAFGAVYKEKQREFPIVALGSFWLYWGGDRRVPYLWSDSGGRDLDLHWFGEDDWYSHYRFLAVREV